MTLYTTMFKQKAIHYPNLKTVLMVERFLQKQKKPLSKNKVLERLPKKIMRPTLNIILEYLELSGKILIGKKGVEWVHDENKKLRIALRKAADDLI